MVFKMAFSKSDVKAQNIIYCQLCETEPKIKWKCVDCDLLMCDKCREKIHPKFKNAKDHKIVDIKEVGNQAEGGGKDFTNIKCKQHQGQTCCIFCTTCDKLLCPSCIAKSHTGHSFLEIKESYEMKLEKLKNRQRKREKEMQNLVQGLQEQNRLQNIASAKCEAVMDSIHAHRETLKKKVDEYADKITKDVQYQLKTITDSISREQSKVEETKTSLQKKIQVAMDIIETTDVSRFYDEVDQLEKSPEEILPPVNLAHNTLPDFVPGDITEANVGLLKIDAGKDSEIELKVIQEYTTKVAYIHYISVGKDGSLWLGDTINTLLMKVKPVGSKLQTISSYSTDLRGIIVTTFNDILFSETGTRLKQITSATGKISDTKYSVDPLLIMSVHMTGNNKIILGAITDNCGKPLWPVKGRRVIIVMDETGEKEAEYEYDSNNQRIISYPWDITTSTKTGNICVIDGIDDDRGRVVVLGEGGKVTGKYTGNRAVNTTGKPFYPRGISVTSLDRIVLTDMHEDILHILDSVGNFISYINTKESGIEYPYCLAWSPTGELYIGCSTEIGSKENAKLYLTDLVGC